MTKGKLVMTLGDEVIGEFPVIKERITIGRLPGNDIQPDDAAVSRRHALVTRARNEVVLEDLNSTNGTLVNGNRVKTWILADGDVIQIGQHYLKYLADIEARQAPATAKKTRSVAGEPAYAQVRVLNGPEAGKLIELSKPYTPVGTLGVQVVVVTRRPEGYSIMNVGGNDGTAAVNGKLIGAKGEMLQNHDIIEVAGTRMEFIFKGP